mgnify:CR=1 FL=1
MAIIGTYVGPLMQPGSLRVLPMMKDGSKSCLLDLQDFQWAKEFSWSHCSGYAKRVRKIDGKQRTICLHVEIAKKMFLAIPEGMQIDHKDRNPLNNRRFNLRLATPSQNIMNQKIGSNNTSGVKGVYWHKASRRWIARIRIYGVTKSKSFLSKEAAIKARKRAEKRHYGEFAPQ